MTALIIAVCVLLLLAVLAVCSVSLVFCFDGETKTKIKYAGITVFNSEKKHKIKVSDKKQSAKPQKKEKKENAFKKIFKEKSEKEGTFGAVKFFFDEVKTVISKTGKLLKKFKIRDFRLNITVATDDAAKTAIEYGAVCTAVYPTLSLLSEKADIDIKKVDISTDFNKTAYDTSLSFFAKTKLIYLVVFAFQIYRELKKITEDKTNGR